MQSAPFSTNHLFLSLFSSKVSFDKGALGNKTKIFYVQLEILVRSLQEMPKFVVLFPIANFAVLMTQPLWL